MKKEKQEYIAWNEGFRAYFIEKSYQIREGFYQEFYIQCIESTYADCYEVFFETSTHYNCFLDEACIEKDVLVMRFYKLVAIHHTICMVGKKQNELDWDNIKVFLFFIFQCSEKEMELADKLYEYIVNDGYQFQVLMIKVTTMYLFEFKLLNEFYFAFLSNFWYNSYNNFISSFVGYIPFKVRMDRFAIVEER